MSPTLGKIDPGTFERLIASRLGASRPEVLMGPRAGCDAAVVKVGAGRVMAITTDPLSVIPALGFEASAVLACHLLASDLWTTGIPPAYASIDLNLPPQMSDADLATYWQAMSAEWTRLGVAVVTGHTGRYSGCDYSIVGGATLIGVGDEGRYVTPAMARPGDRVLVTKGCAIEATAIAARLMPRRLRAHIDDDGVARARAMLTQVSVVLDCRAALRVGVRERGVTALHDATEGGVLGGLVELARGCGHDLRIEQARIPLSPETVAACAAWGGIDPFWTLSEGTLLVCVAAEHTAAVIAAIAEEHIVVAEIGEVMPGSGTVWLTGADDAVRPLTHPEPDPYWAAYAHAVEAGWN